MTRNVKSTAAALARTSRPVVGDGLENVIAGLGTSKDKRSYNNYRLSRTIDRVELEAMYRSSWLAKRIINSVADDMTRKGWEYAFDDGKPENRLVIEKADKKYNIPGKINEALKWARLYGGCVILIGTKDKDPSKPLDITKIKQGDLRYLHVMDRWRVSAGQTICYDLDSPNFGMPDSYIVAESSVVFHHTRVIRFNGQKLPYFLWRQNAMWDDSELQHTYDALTSNDQTTASIATMLFEANIDVITSEDLGAALSTKQGEAALIKRFGLSSTLKSMNNMLLLDGKEKYEKKSNTFANLDKILEKFMQQVCGASDIPMTRLFGQSPGGLSATGDSDLTNYYDMLSARQVSEMLPQLNYLYEIVCRSELSMMPDDFTITFKPLWQVSQVAQATIDFQNAQRDEKYLNLGVVDEPTVAKQLKEDGVYPNMTDETIKMITEVSKEPPPPPPPPAIPGAVIPTAPKKAAEPDKVAPDQPVAGVTQKK